jgi:hypothetical protein
VRTDRRFSLVRARLADLCLAIAAFVALVGAAAPAPFPATLVRNYAQQGDGSSAGGGTGGTLLSELGPLLLIALGIAVVVLVAAVIILFRTRGAVTPPASSEGWWTCSNCGAGNMDGVARCHACSTWRATSPRPTPSA